MATYDPYGNSGIPHGNQYNQQYIQPQGGEGTTVRAGGQPDYSGVNWQQGPGVNVPMGGAGGPPQTGQGTGTPTPGSGNMTINGITYNSQGQQLDSLGNVAYGSWGNNNNQQGNQQPGWGQPGGPNWQASQGWSGEGPNPYQIGNFDPATGLPSGWNMPGTFNDWMAATPEARQNMSQWLSNYLPFAAQMGNLTSQAQQNQMAGQQQWYQQNVADPWQREFATGQWNEQVLNNMFNRQMQGQSFQLEQEMANRGMGLQERQQVHQQALDLAKQGLDERALNAQIDNMAGQLQINRDTLAANVNLAQQRIDMENSQFSQKLGFDYANLDQQQKQFVSGLAEQARQANMQNQIQQQTLLQQAQEFAKTHGLAVQQVMNTKEFQDAQIRLDQQRANTEQWVAQQTAGLRSRELDIGERQFGQTLGWEKERFGQEMGWQQQMFGQQMGLEQQRLAEQARQATLQAVGRLQAPNTRWLRRS